MAATDDAYTRELDELIASVRATSELLKQDIILYGVCYTDGVRRIDPELVKP